MSLGSSKSSGSVSSSGSVTEFCGFRLPGNLYAKITYSGYNENRWNVPVNWYSCNGTDYYCDQQSYIGIEDINGTYYAKIAVDESNVPWGVGQISHTADVKIGYWYNGNLLCSRDAVEFNPLVGALHGGDPSPWTLGVQPAYRLPRPITGLTQYTGDLPYFGRDMESCAKLVDGVFGPEWHEYASFAEWKADFDTTISFEFYHEGWVTIDIEAVVM
ncbi:hypothetical protein Pla52o_35010 [Novipirellula galeiformis]|uniref:Uncharacterized protein n=1 Tax=Novipirellula galeiformis TaxID=2528004 RepID=A0A5C6CEK1_9BACT|nr:hypothetical protein [Novipirellula galeiformis]TWU22445.1 hypothetical protein Pla52o_35010 [Novipirellula galeiformis]